MSLASSTTHTRALSRRVLERRYRNSTGRTPHHDLVRFRIDRVKQLLAETDLIMAVDGYPRIGDLTPDALHRVGG